MRSARLAATVLLVFCACSSGSKSSQDGAAGAPDGGKDLAPLGGSGGSTAAGGSTGTGGSVGGTSVGGGTGLGGTLSSTASGGRGGSAGATTASGGSTSGPDAGTGGSTRPDGGASSGSDASMDVPVDTRPDSAVDGADTGRTEVSPDDGGASGLAFCRATSTGCQCTSVATGEPTIPACSKQSLGVAHEARCCQSSAHCSCDSLGCVAETSGGRCRCDFASLLALMPPTYTKVAQCPAPASGTKCCLHSVEGTCECKQQTCPAGSTEVTTCTPALLSACASGEQAVESCK